MTLGGDFNSFLVFNSLSCCVVNKDFIIIIIIIIITIFIIIIIIIIITIITKIICIP